MLVTVRPRMFRLAVRVRANLIFAALWITDAALGFSLRRLPFARFGLFRFRAVGEHYIGYSFKRLIPSGRNAHPEFFSLSLRCDHCTVGFVHAVNPA